VIITNESSLISNEHILDTLLPETETVDYIFDIQTFTFSFISIEQIHSTAVI
jgi:hypothetical protein